MPTLLQQLENNEAVLLMYLADELPPEDRVEVEQLLASEPRLRVELEQMRVAHHQVLTVLRDLDRGLRPAVSEPVAVRQVARAMKQWRVDQLSSQPKLPSRSRLRFPWWAYPTASAAAIVLAVLVWWGMKPEPGAEVARGDQQTQQQDGPFPNDPVFQQAVMVADSLVMSREANGPGINDAEEQASALKHDDDEAAAILMFDPGSTAASAAPLSPSNQ
jgi:anti-sigma factor RsiW